MRWLRPSGTVFDASAAIVCNGTSDASHDETVPIRLPRATLLAFGLLALAMFGVAAIAEVDAAGQGAVAAAGADGPSLRELLHLCLEG